MLSWWPVDVTPINRFFGTSLRHESFATHVVPAAWRRIPDALPVPQPAKLRRPASATHAGVHVEALRDVRVRMDHLFLGPSYDAEAIKRVLENCKLRFTDDALEAIAEAALKRKIGARGLRMIIEDLMLDLMYNLPGQKKVRECVITREVVQSKEKPITLIEKAG